MKLCTCDECAITPSEDCCQKTVRQLEEEIKALKEDKLYYIRLCQDHAERASYYERTLKSILKARLLKRSSIASDALRSQGVIKGVKK